MSSSEKQTVLVIGGTGAQGTPVVKALTKDSAYNVRILTRSTTSPSAQALASLPGVTILAGSPFNEASLHTALSGSSIVFANTNGFAVGEKAEIYWGIRIYELAREHNVKHFIWSSLDSSYEISGYQPRFRTGHFDGKAKVERWISTQDSKAMKWSFITSCLYMEMLGQTLGPVKEKGEDGEEVFVFAAPVGSGSPPLICLDDLGEYARWIIDHPEKSNEMNLRLATEHVGWEYLAKTFTEVTGKKAVFRDLTLDEYFASGVFSDPDRKVGHSVEKNDETLQTFRQNFGNFWNTWKEDVILRDTKVLDEILPNRIRTVGEWMRLTGYTGEKTAVTKDYRDGVMAARKAS
ncbi:hypothetical protein G7Y89_g15650 [Cudoniella acicularis]|uniref:NmrA-like domain-containing protein n=1 Tax=Cudoniella acicularis TaxID=354080 RepID=A0A8H4QI59_9HELO|nr:hypothetical protein G7Y89_g15650 [Cudoniella acicularis]